MATDGRAGFDPTRTRTDKTKLAAWLMAKVEGDLNEVPGIGPTTKGVLIEAGITTICLVCDVEHFFGVFLVIIEFPLQRFTTFPVAPLNVTVAFGP